VSSPTNGNNVFRPFTRRPAQIVSGFDPDASTVRIPAFQLACCRALRLAGFHVDDLNVGFPHHVYDLGLAFANNPRQVVVDIIATNEAAGISVYCFCRQPLFERIPRTWVIPGTQCIRHREPDRPAVGLASFLYVSHSAQVLHDQGWGPVLLLLDETPQAGQGLELCAALDPQVVYDVITVGQFGSNAAGEAERSSAERLTWLAHAAEQDLEDDLHRRTTRWNAAHGSGRQLIVSEP
jgi:hypothetical protein